MKDYSDAQLLDAIRSGNGARNASHVLYARHRRAVELYVRQREFNHSKVDDLVSEAFVRLFEQLHDGKGPTLSVRQYLYVTVSHMVSTTLSARVKEIPVEIDYLDAPTAGEIDGQLVQDFENSTLRTAFRSLPDRWQEILWYSEVEGVKRAELTEILGMNSNAISAVLHRAKDGLSKAYLEAYLAAELPPECAAHAPELAAKIRHKGSRPRNRTAVDAHFEKCEHCSALISNSANLGTALRAIVAPVIVGSAAAALWPTSSASAAAAASLPVGKVAIVCAFLAIAGAGALVAQGLLPEVSAAPVPAPAASHVAVDTPNPQPTLPPVQPTQPAEQEQTPVAPETFTPQESSVPTPPEPLAVAEPASVSYSLDAPGSVASGEVGVASITINNVGGSASHTLNFGLTTNNAAQFSLQSTASSPANAGWSCSTTLSSVQCQSEGLGQGETSTVNIAFQITGTPGGTASFALTSTGEDLAADSDQGTIHQTLVAITS